MSEHDVLTFQTHRLERTHELRELQTVGCCGCGVQFVADTEDAVIADWEAHCEELE
jgi:hypothetical protein